jgi:hypothetical protein
LAQAEQVAVVTAQTIHKTLLLVQQILVQVVVVGQADMQQVMAVAVSLLLVTH